MSILQTVRNLFSGGTRDPGPMRQEPLAPQVNLDREGGTTDPGVMAPPPTRPHGSIETSEAANESGSA